MTAAYPLQWPAGWPRTPSEKRQDSKYRFVRSSRMGSSYWTFSEARDELFTELKRLGARSLVLSTNFPLSRAGVPSDRGRRPDDNGVAIYFVLGGKQTVMACDMHVRAEENMRSLALSIEAMRALERHGGGAMMNRAFEGFAQLEAPGAKHWSAILGVARDASKAQITEAFRRLARERHPDQGGSDAMMAELNAARDTGLKEAPA